jgi:predicted Ser/Thr protein kinase
MIISFSELSNVCLAETQGESWSSIYAATYQGEEVVVKAQKPGSRKKAIDINDDRFEQALDVLKVPRKHVVKVYGWGEDFNDERFVVMEKLHEIPEGLSKDQVQEIVDAVYLTARDIYLTHDHFWGFYENVMFDKNGVVKIFDFNDDATPGVPFINNCEDFDMKCYNYKFVATWLCERDGYDPDEVLRNTYRKLVEAEYQSLDNVHEPIYFNEFNDIPKCETDPNDADYGKLVKANRTCTDRADLIKANITNISGMTSLDIGTNVGWFTFLMDELGAVATGVDFDRQKIDFNNMISQMYEKKANFSFADVDRIYVEQMPEFDIIMALSILHLFFSQHGYTPEEFEELFIGMCRKAKKYFIFETSSLVLEKFQLGSWESLCELTKKLGTFKEVRIIGTSVEGRPLILCSR